MPLKHGPPYQLAQEQSRVINATVPLLLINAILQQCCGVTALQPHMPETTCVRTRTHSVRECRPNIIRPAVVGRMIIRAPPSLLANNLATPARCAHPDSAAADSSSSTSTAKQTATAGCEVTISEPALLSIPSAQHDQDTPDACSATDSQEDAFNTYLGALSDARRYNTYGAASSMISPWPTHSISALVMPLAHAFVVICCRPSAAGAPFGGLQSGDYGLGHGIRPHSRICCGRHAYTGDFGDAPCLMNGNCRTAWR